MNDKKNEEALIKQRHEQNLEAQRVLQKEIDEATETTIAKFNLSQPKKQETTKKEFEALIEAYKVRKPTKYIAKKDKLKKQLAKLK